MTAKKLVIPVAVVLLLGSTFFVTPQANAQGFGMGHANFFSGLVQFFAQKFGLDKTKVQSAVNEYQHNYSLTPRPTLSPDQIKTRAQGRLDALVKAGKITSDQEKAILSELDSLRSKYNMNDLMNQTPDQRRSMFQSLQNDIKTWAQSQNIDPKYVLGGFGIRGFGRREMMGVHGRFGMWSPSTTPTPTP